MPIRWRFGRQLAAIGVVAVFVPALLFALATMAAGDSAPNACGQTITADLSLSKDLTFCPADGLIAGADDITIHLRGHVISGLGTNPDSAGIRVSGRMNVTILGPGTVTLFRTGVFIAFSREVTVREVSALSNGLMALFPPPSLSDGIRVTASTDVWLERNLAKGNGDDGIHVHTSLKVGIVRNQVVDNYHAGIRLDRTHDSVIVSNRVSRHDTFEVVPPETTAREVGVGIELWGSKNNTIERNRVVGNHNGIRLRAYAAIASTGNVVERNVVSESAVRGIHLRDESTSSNEITMNWIAGNAAGIRLTNGPTGNLIFGNRIRENRCGIKGPTESNSLEDNHFARNDADFCP